jgi:hypothetical protein
MPPEQAEELIVNLGLPRNMNEPGIVSKGASRQDALTRSNVLANDLQGLKSNVVDQIPPPMSGDVAEGLRTQAQNPLLTQGEADVGVPMLNNMANKYENIGNRTPSYSAGSTMSGDGMEVIEKGPVYRGDKYTSNPVPPALLAQESSNLTSQLPRPTDPFSKVTPVNEGQTMSRDAIDEILQTQAGPKLGQDLSQVNTGLENTRIAQSGLRSVMSPASEGATQGLQNSGGGFVNWMMNRDLAQRGASAAGLGAKETASWIMRNMDTRQFTPDTSKYMRILQIIMDSDTPEVDMEVAMSDPGFNRHTIEVRKKENVGH